MRTQLEGRLAQLKAEFDQGQKMLADLETQQANLMRISGAIQVLEELLASDQPQEQTQSTSPE